jgi:hypothetical protein
MSYDYVSNSIRASIPGQSTTEAYADLPTVDNAANDPIPGNRVPEGYLGDR